MNRDATILIVGASARYLAQSARSATINSVAIDLFADWDTRQICEIHQIASLSDVNFDGLAIRGLPTGFVICGGMETRVGELKKLQPKVPFRGPSLSSLERTQNPDTLRQICAQANIRFPELRLPDQRSTHSADEWLLKPKLGSGGFQIRRWQGEIAAHDDFYLQQFIEGECYGALFASGGGSTRLLGVARQLDHQSFFRPAEFAYCGSLGPVFLASELQNEIERMGRQVGELLELKGCFGIDFILDKHQELWLMEVNPRITSSAEVLELAVCFDSVIDIHLNCFSDKSPDPPASPVCSVGKAIVYSNQHSEFQVTEEAFSWLVENSLHYCSHDRSRFSSCKFKKPFWLADIPVSGTMIRPGHPVCTAICFDQTLSTANTGSLPLRLARALDETTTRVFGDKKTRRECSAS